MVRKKKNESIWHYLSVDGLGEFTMPRIKFWYEFVPGFAYKAIWFGRQRRRWLIEKQYLVLYHDVVQNECFVIWTSSSNLCSRDTAWGDEFYNTGLKKMFLNPNTDI